MGQHKLSAQVRTSKGKGVARKLRRNNQIPAIFYGPNTEPVMLTVDYPDLKLVLKQAAGDNILIDLQVNSDQGSETRKVILKELLMHPLKDTYLHADFYEISMDKEITVDIPIRLVNTAKGVELGGVLQHIRRELAVSCMPDKMTDIIEVDVSDLDIGDSIHIRDVVLPEGMKSLDEAHLTVAIVAAPTKKEEVVEEEVTEEGVEEEAAPSEESTEEQK